MLQVEDARLSWNPIIKKGPEVGDQLLKDNAVAGHSSMYQLQMYLLVKDIGRVI